MGFSLSGFHSRGWHARNLKKAGSQFNFEQASG
jgi:hypothetical protein